MKCPNCNNEVSPEWKTCPYCEYKPNRCSNANCKAGWLPREAHFCPQCGSPVAGEENLNLKNRLAEIMKIEAKTDNSFEGEDIVFTVGGVQFKMVFVEEGSFLMGATSEQGSDVDGDEKQVHRVSLSSYYIGETQVTQELWKVVMGDNPSNRKDCNMPVGMVSWHDCQEFLKKLNNTTGKTFRLPTEAEWEYAARGGRKSQERFRYAGSNNIDEVAWYYDSNSGGQPHPVKQKKPNELGLYDMSGNVKEWCLDGVRTYSSRSEVDPKGPSSSGDYRAYRGGSFLSTSKGCRVSFRLSNSLDYRSSEVGFRLALVHESEN